MFRFIQNMTKQILVVLDTPKKNGEFMSYILFIK